MSRYNNRTTFFIIAVAIIIIVAILFFILTQGTTTLPKPDPLPAEVPETAVVTLPLSGDASQADAELSSLAWYNDTLILLPQYPSLFGNNLFTLAKADILNAIDTGATLTPNTISINTGNLENIDSFEGLESIAFNGDVVYITIESSPGSSMLGTIVSGKIEPDLSAITLDDTTLVDIQPQAAIANASYETLIIADGNPLTPYEDNGANVNPNPVIYQFSDDLSSNSTIPFPNIEYRITDATVLDENGRFWVTNYIFPNSIEKVDPVPDPLAIAHGMGATHAEYNVVERLIELQYSERAITLTDTPPIPFQLLGDDSSRNWEGVVRLDDQGFLVVTDKFPETILGFVATP